MAGTAGHIDHGKTRMVKLFTGCETDTLSEEKERGMSINLGFAPCPLGRGKRIGLGDVPGHEDFIRNMVAGVTGIDIVLLTVAADDGIMPQTVEHFNITHLLGVKKGIALITKSDLVPPERIEEVRADLVNFFKGTFMEDCQIIPFSAETADGIGLLRKELDKVVDETKRRKTEGVFRLPVERAFSAEGFGTIMTGIASSGKLSIRDEVEILPVGQKGVVRKLQVFGLDQEEGYAGQCLAVNVGGVDRKVVERGFVLATAGYFKGESFIHARLNVLRDASAPIKNRTPIRFHTGTSEAFGKVLLLEKDRLEPGQNGLVQFELESPVITEPGDHYIVRLQNPVVTVGGGRVIGYSPRRMKRLKSWINEALQGEETAVDEKKSRASFEIHRSGKDGLEKKELSIKATLTPKQTDEVIEELTGEGKIHTLPGDRIIVSSDSLESYKDELLAKLDELHKADPTRIGFTAVNLRKQTGVRTELTNAALAILLEEKKIALENERYRLASFEVKLDDSLSGMASELESLYLERDFKTPRPEELPTLVKGSPADIEKMLRKLVESGILIRTTPQILFHRDNVELARRKTVAYIEENGELESFEFKNIIGSSRKYAIPLLDHFDATGVTRRGHQNKRYLKK